MRFVNFPLDDGLKVTYETATDQPMHPDFMIASRFIEVGMSDCSYGCKIYADPRSNVKVLAHNKTYGCDVTTEVVESWSKMQEDFEAGQARLDAYADSLV